MKEQSFEVVSTEELQEVVGGRRRHHYSDLDRVGRDVDDFMHGLIDGLAGYYELNCIHAITCKFY